MSQTEFEAIKNLLGSRVVAYYPSLGLALKDPRAALYLCQLCFWGERLADDDGWFYKTVEHIERETGILKDSQQRCREQLVRARMIEADLRGMPRRWHYRIQWDQLAKLLAGIPPAVGDAEIPVAVDHRRKQRSSVPTGSGKPPPHAAVEDRPIESKDRSKKRSKDKRGRHTAHPFPVQVFRMVTHRNPPKKLHDRIHRVVGDDFWANLKWGRVVKWWMMKGYNQSNYQGMLDVFANGTFQNQGSKSGLDVMRDYLDERKTNGQ